MTVISCMNTMLTRKEPWNIKAMINEIIELTRTIMAETWKDVEAKALATMTLASLMLASDLLRFQ